MPPFIIKEEQKPSRFKKRLRNFSTWLAQVLVCGYALGMSISWGLNSYGVVLF